MFTTNTSNVRFQGVVVTERYGNVKADVCMTPKGMDSALLQCLDIITARQKPDTKTPCFGEVQYQISNDRRITINYAENGIEIRLRFPETESLSQERQLVPHIFLSSTTVEPELKNILSRVQKRIQQQLEFKSGDAIDTSPILPAVEKAITAFQAEV